MAQPSHLHVVQSRLATDPRRRSQGSGGKHCAVRHGGLTHTPAVTGENNGVIADYVAAADGVHADLPWYGRIERVVRVS